MVWIIKYLQFRLPIFVAKISSLSVSERTVMNLPAFLPVKIQLKSKSFASTCLRLLVSSFSVAMSSISSVYSIGPRLLT